MELPYGEQNPSLRQSNFGQDVKQFFKEDVKTFFKEDVKNFFGKASEFTKKTFSKKEQLAVSQSEEDKFQQTQNEVKKEKGLKALGSKVKLGFSKLFKPKVNPVKFEEHKESEDLAANAFPFPQKAQVDDLNLIEDDDELKQQQMDGMIAKEIAIDQELSLKNKLLVAGTFELQKSEYIEPSGLISEIK